ncbi:hypothetical protein [Psychrobacillus sp.]|uniref:hypothetical protein n=1 Tax=Psychrobacillus sp. TaxID=1871623 RepID=UPI0028BF5A64|nr:hypothetical protein [Psychrobacillus sp.]
MSKNNKKTMNIRTHNSQDLYKKPNDNPDEEFAAEFDSQAPKNSMNKHRQPQPKKKK